MTTESQIRPRGRPRRAATDAAILRATVDLLAEVGIKGATLTAVAQRAGVARATVYLRWPSRSALIGAAARTAVGGQPMPLTADIEHDIRFAASFMQRAFDHPAMRAILPEIVRGVLAEPTELAFDSVAPRRREFARLYGANAAAAGFDPDVDPNIAFDIILGTAIAYLLANRHPMGARDAAKLGEVLVRGLRRTERPG